MALVDRPQTRISNPNDMTGIDLRPPSEEVDVGPGALIGAAFRMENPLVSMLSRQSAGGPVDPDFDWWGSISGTPYEPYSARFANVFNRAQADALKAQIDRENADRRTIDAAGGWGLLASIGAGVFSPEILLPGGNIYRGVRAGQAAARTAVSTATWAGVGATTAELALQSTQETRTATESALNIGGSVILGGALGGGISAAVSRMDWARFSAAADADLRQPFDGVDPQRANEDALQGELQRRLASNETASDAGAAARTVDTLEDLTIAGRAAQFTGQAFGGLNPVLRTLQSPSVEVRNIATRLYENPIYMRKNMEGQASAPGVETLVKEYTQGHVARAIEQHQNIYREFRQNGGTMSQSDFNRAVGQAMRRSDTAADPRVSKAAEAWRRDVFNPLKEQAIEAGLLPADVSVSTAESYFSRVYNVPMMIAQEQRFKGIVRNWADEVISSLQFKSEEITIGNRIVEAETAADQFSAARQRFETSTQNLEAREARRAGMVRNLEETELSLMQAREEAPPPELLRILRNAGDTQDAITAVREARQARRSGANRSYRERFPVLSLLRDRGGVRVGTPLDADLRALGVTPQSHPGLFRKAGGRSDVDNLVWGEDEILTQNLNPIENGYLAPNDIMEAIRAEIGGTPLRTEDQRMMDQNVDALVDYADSWLDQVGLGRNASVKEVRDYLRTITAANRQYDDMIARVDRLEAELQKFDTATDPLVNERIVREEAMIEAETQMQALNEEILQYQDIARASPNVGIILDYATAKRDLGKQRIRQSAVARRVQALKRVEQRGRLNDDLARELRLKTDELTRFDPAINRLEAKVEKLQPMLPKMRQELPDFVSDADRQDYVNEIVNNIYDTLLGRNADGEIPRDIVAATRGPLKERTFNIPDRMIEDFLESDVEKVARRYARVMAADVELTRTFGRADMKEQIDAVRAEYTTARERVEADLDDAGNPKNTPRAQIEKRLRELTNREKTDVQDIRALRDLIRGTYKREENASNYARVARVAGTLNYLRALGGVTISSLSDVSRHVMVHGLGPVMNDGLVPMIRNLKGFKMSVQEAKTAGAVTERLLNTRLATWADIADPYSASSPFERFMDNTAAVFSKLNGLVFWNDFQKSFASVLTQSRILRGSTDYASLGKRERAYLAYLGIDAGMAERIGRQFQRHGTTEDGDIRVAGTDDWDDIEARRIYRAAINKDVDTTIVTRGVGDVPLFMHTPTGRLVGQFKSFALASNQRMLMRGLQERPSGFVAGTMMAATVGMMIYWLKSVESNRMDDISDNPGRWIAEGLDRSGIFALAFEVNNTVEKAFGVGAYGALSALFPSSDQDGKSSRYIMRSTAAGFAGPTADFIDTAVRAVAAIKDTTSGDGLTEGDINAIRRLAPFASLPGIRSFVEYVGIPAVVEGVN
ncbi:hypothetical protein [Pelagibacterium luteolum]|uniref:Uncharacterized protein n=1 Tax=Pelagibacterium luteolum TaxID=440168 RepID=A0A1G7ZJ21_9HYPH|nr:hypothetical protein [Pelagibacterium luteolum]SDH08577.1 hypothetical protein SAMN04487974_12041 [Pelagibacterium luteolum]